MKHDNHHIAPTLKLKSGDKKTVFKVVTEKDITFKGITVWLRDDLSDGIQLPTRILHTMNISFTIREKNKDISEKQ